MKLKFWTKPVSKKKNGHKKALTKKEQLGRTVVEVLGILGIAGVLSIGGLYGYRYGMEVHRENQTLDMISKTAAGAITGYTENLFLSSEEDDEGASLVPISSVISGYPIEDDYTVISPQETTAEVSVSKRTILLDIENITYSVCAGFGKDI